MPWPPVTPVFPAGMEPLPPGMTEDDRKQLLEAKKYQEYMAMGMESCVAKVVMAGGAGMAFGGFFALMSASFAYEDPLMRQQAQAGMNNAQKAREIFREMGRDVWRRGKGFAKVGALYSGLECAVESYRARNDMVNPVAAGFMAGGILARKSGPRAVLGGGLAFAAFSAAIDLFLRRDTSDDDD